MKSDFKPWDKVRYTQDYLDHRELVVGIPLSLSGYLYYQKATHKDCLLGRLRETWE